MPRSGKDRRACRLLFDSRLWRSNTCNAPPPTLLLARFAERLPGHPGAECGDAHSEVRVEKEGSEVSQGLPGLRSSDAGKRLGIYLNDHLGGSLGGLELARRAASSNRGDPSGEFLSTLVEKIDQDIVTLKDVMDRLGVRKDPLKQGLGWTAEKLGRLKLNGQLLGYSPLSRLVELESLALGVEGKLALWQTLKATLDSDPRLMGIDFDRLIARAREQRAGLERQRLVAAKTALSGSRHRATV
jgi:hypothetical protein